MFLLQAPRGRHANAPHRDHTTIDLLPHLLYPALDGEGQDHTAGTLVNDDIVERYLTAVVRFVMTGWTNWVAQGARAYQQKVVT